MPALIYMPFMCSNYFQFSTNTLYQVRLNIWFCVLESWWGKIGTNCKNREMQPCLCLMILGYFMVFIGNCVRGVSIVEETWSRSSPSKIVRVLFQPLTNTQVLHTVLADLCFLFHSTHFDSSGSVILITGKRVQTWDSVRGFLHPFHWWWR